jgi:predicted metal-dependent phosphoesterase TrpH
MSKEHKQLEIFRYGSVWLRADFHLHTKADKEFVYNGEENSFLDDYVAKLKEHNIKIGVIANHNKFDKSEFDSLKKKQ